MTPPSAELAAALDRPVYPLYAGAIQQATTGRNDMNTATFTATLTDKQIAQAMAAISATDTADQVAIFGALEDELTTRRPSIAQKFDAVYDEGLRGAALLRALATTAINSIAK